MFHILFGVDLNREFLSLFGGGFPEIYISRIEFRWLHFVEEARNSPARRLHRKLPSGEAQHLQSKEAMPSQKNHREIQINSQRNPNKFTEKSK